MFVVVRGGFDVENESRLNTDAQTQVRWCSPHRKGLSVHLPTRVRSVIPSQEVEDAVTTDFARSQMAHVFAEGQTCQCVCRMLAVPKNETDWRTCVPFHVPNHLAYFVSKCDVVDLEEEINVISFCGILICIAWKDE